MIVGNRGFFPDHLAQSGRNEMIAGHRKGRLRSSRRRRRKKPSTAPSKPAMSRTICADLFKRRRDEIDGIIVTLPNFGEERAIADTLRLAGLDVPVLVQATPDTPGQMTIRDRRDSFCGKMSRLQQPQAVRHSLLAHHPAHRSSRFRRLRQRSRLVRRRLPRRARPAPHAHRRHRRAPRRVQHRALQREAARSQRHLRRAHRPLRDPRPHRPHEGHRQPRKPNSKPSASTSPPTGAASKRS